MSHLKQYCDAVIDNKIVASKRVKQICRRLLEDIEHPDGFHFDKAKALRPIEFIEKFCCYPSGEKMGQPMKLELFQKAWIEAMFGFVDDNGRRKYNSVLIICGRKNGKSSLLSAIMLYMLVGDGEGSPQVYSAATALDQAKITFAACHKMVQKSPMLAKHIKKRATDLYFSPNLGFIKALASETNHLDGLDIHCAVIDELAALKNRDVFDLLYQGMSARTQPLLVCITTNGFVRGNIFDDQYEYACGVLDGKIDNPRFLAWIYELDDESEWLDEECYIKANPGLGTIKSVEFLKECVQKAKDDPSFKPTLLTKDFNLKQNSESAFLKWEELNNEQTFDIPFDYCIGGFDAADTTDLNAAKAIMMRPGDPNIYVKSMYWIPQAVLEQTGKTGSRRERDNVPYSLWVDQGYMRTCEGNKCDKRIFLEWFKELREQEDLYTLYIGYDPWHISDDLLREFKAEFGERAMIPVRQGTITLSEPMKELKAEFGAHHIIYNNNPVDKFCFMNVNSKADINGNIQPVKGMDARKRIDGFMALLDAYKVLLDKRDEYVNLNEGD